MSIPFSTLVDDELLATVSATGPPSVSATVDWGDGMTSVVNFATDDATHTYAELGLYEVEVLIPSSTYAIGAIVVDGADHTGTLFSSDTTRTTLLPELPDYCWPVDTEELPGWDDWEVEPDPEADPPEAGVPLYSELVKARAMSLAGQSMRLLTGFRVGGCPVIVRPCSRRCESRTWRTYPIRGYPGSTPWWPVNLGGQWLNIGCGEHSDGCSCSRTYEVRLASATQEILEVKVDGAVLDPSAYRLDPGGRLVRVDGEAWPLCQDLNAPDSEDGTWSVTYVPGAPVDGLGAVAAGWLALEYAKALVGDDECSLPTTVTQVVRLGVTMTLAPGSFPEGKTGIRIVDDYVTRWNPHGYLYSPSAVYNIDLPGHRAVKP